MEPIRVINLSCSLMRSVWILSLFLGCSALGGTVANAGEVEEVYEVGEIEVPWSQRAEDELAKHQDKFQEIRHFYTFRSPWLDVWGRLFFLNLLGLCVYLVFGKKVLDVVLPNPCMIIRMILCLGYMIWFFEEAKHYYGLWRERGYIFLTDTGVLVVYQGYSGDSFWLSYDHIDTVEVFSMAKNLSRDNILLRIVDRGKRNRYFRVAWFESPSMLDELLRRLRHQLDEHRKKVKKVIHRTKDLASMSMR